MEHRNKPRFPMTSGQGQRFANPSIITSKRHFSNLRTKAAHLLSASGSSSAMVSGPVRGALGGSAMSESWDTVEVRFDRRADVLG